MLKYVDIGSRINIVEGRWGQSVRDAREEIIKGYAKGRELQQTSRIIVVNKSEEQI